MKKIINEFINTPNEEDNEIGMCLLVFGTIGFILIVGPFLLSINDFIQDKISFYQIKNIVKNIDTNELRLNKNLFSMKTNTFELTQLNKVSTDKENYDLARYNGAVLEIKNLTNKTCTIEKSFFDRFIGASDFMEIQNQVLKPSEETYVFLAYKNLSFSGYHSLR